MKPISVFNYTIRNSSDDTVDVYIDGAIVDAESQQIMKDWFGDDTSVSYKSIRDQITKANPKNVKLHINSPGGIVTDAMAIHDYLIELENKGVNVSTYGKGIIASAATYILMACKNSHMSENSWFMIHNMSGMVWGDVNEIENYAKTIRKFNNSARDFYASRTGIRKEDVSRMMDSETWMTAAECKEKGFISNVDGSANFSNAIEPNYWPYSNQSVLNAYNSFTQKNNDMDIKTITDGVTAAVTNAFDALLNKLGIKKEENKEAEDAGKEFSNAISTAMANALKPLEGLETLITNTVTTAVQNVTKEITPEKIAETVKNEVTAATKGFATSTDLTNLQGEVAKKLGGAALENEGEKETEGERKFKNKKQFFRAGSFENN